MLTQINQISEKTLAQNAVGLNINVKNTTNVCFTLIRKNCILHVPTFTENIYIIYIDIVYFEK